MGDDADVIGEEIPPTFDLTPPKPDHTLSGPRDERLRHRRGSAESNGNPCSGPQKSASSLKPESLIERRLDEIQYQLTRSEWAPGLLARAFVIGLGYMVGGNSYNSPNGMRTMLVILLVVLINEFAFAVVNIRRRAWLCAQSRELDMVMGPSSANGCGVVRHPLEVLLNLIPSPPSLTDAVASRLRKKNNREDRDCAGKNLPHNYDLDDFATSEFYDRLYGKFERTSITVRYFSITAVTYAITEALKKLFYGGDELVGIVFMLAGICMINEVNEALTTPPRR